MLMSELLLVLGYALLPAAGNAAGGLLAEVTHPSSRSLSIALHLAAGIVLAVVGVELTPRVLDTDMPWVPLLAFVAGGGAFLALERVVEALECRMQDGQGGLAVYAGVSIDLLSDGILIGTGSVIDPALGLLLALGQVPADLPEGFAAAATLRERGVPRARRLWLSAAFALPVLFGAAVGYLALRNAPEILTLSVLATTGAVLLAVAVEEVVGEAHEHPHGRADIWALVIGFALFTGTALLLGD